MSKKKINHFIFILGLSLGICLSIIYFSQSTTSIMPRMIPDQLSVRSTPRAAVVKNTINNIVAETINHDIVAKFKGPTVQPIVGTNEALKLEKEVRVLCWIMTSPKTLNWKCDAVKKTWGKRCNKVLYFSSKTDDNFPAIGLNVSEGREHLTEKTMMAFTYIYRNHFNDADWFMKADDDTYVIVENLRYFLSTKNSSLPVYYGHWFKPYIKQGYYSGGAGYVLSKEALRRFGKFSNKSCVKEGKFEDLDFGKCMEALRVKTGSSHDDLGRSRFHYSKPGDMLHRIFPSWYLEYDKYGGKKNTMSDYPVSFHYMTPKAMFTMEYYVYHLKPYGIPSK
ncbi:glycoprotein-N-acetylgalactosamine 3-beta-galactosyltransferase 1 [Patella vulgata]|uniref:glycoprotein-N-acetylgalactosamine 3-beta-galactosyltransferase 1 n=1 Tax=Patella vulgata TaxID=6465 RepID=UPI0024A89A38|nr:glycoprotein-N-acetylgalactosamine 3-beta-galactosyltransferase 1 [Patella vulgata]